MAGLARQRRQGRAPAVHALRRARERGRARRRLQATSSTMWRAGYDMPEDEFEAEVDRLWGQVKPLYDAAALLHAPQAQQDVRRQGRAEDRPDPERTSPATCGRRRGASSTRSSSRTRASAADRRHADAREEVRREEDGEDGRGVLHVARHEPAAGDVLGALDVRQAEGQGGRLSRERVGRARSRTTCASRCASTRTRRT